MHGIVYSFCNLPRTIPIGFEGEKNFRRVSMDCTPWLAEHPTGVVQAAVMRPNDTEASLVAITMAGNTAVWLVDAWAAQTAGYGSMQFILVVGDTVVGKSPVVTLDIQESIPVGSEPPVEPDPTWFDQILQASATATTKAQEASQSAAAAAGSATSADTSASAAAGFASDASGYASSAATHDAEAQAAKNAAQSAQAAAEQSEINAADSETAAENSARLAAESADDAEDSAQTAQTAAQTAGEEADRAEEAVTKYPYIGENNDWYVWNAEEEQFVDTGISAQGRDAIVESPTAPSSHNVLWRNTTDGKLYYYNGTQWAEVGSGGGSGSATWDSLTGKPFDRIGENLKIVGRTLTVDTAPNVQQDNTKPITSAAVYTEVGNINALLALI